MRRLSLIAAAVFILFSYGALFLGKSKDGKIKRTRPKIKETSAVYYFNSRLLMSRQYFNSACLWPPLFLAQNKKKQMAKEMGLKISGAE